MTRELHRQACLDYLGERTGTYEWRCLRYAVVWDRLERMGLAAHDLVVDVGAGMCDLDRYARTVRAFDGRYLPVDGAIDGTDLEAWTPGFTAEFFVAVEVIEHLRDPMRLVSQLEQFATKGVVVTTPNPSAVDVLAIDRTHVTPVGALTLVARGYTVDDAPLFGKARDTLVAYRPAMPEHDDYVSPTHRLVAGLDRG